MTFVFKHPSKYRKEKMTKYVNIKDCVVGKKYRFEKHWHVVANDEVNLSYMTGTCVTNHIYKDRDKVFDEHEHLIEIQMHVDIPQFQGEFENKAMFYFPHDEHYKKVKVVDYE